MSLPKAVKQYTPQEYYALERDAEEKHDYYQGEIFPTGLCAAELLDMADGTRRHSRICTNIIREVGSRLKGSGCTEYESNLRLRIKATGLRTYPDVSVYCGPVERDEEDSQQETYTNPSVLFEVLSPSTEAYDRGFKAQNYRQIESLRTYVLIAQDSFHAEIFERQSNDAWSLHEVRGPGAILSIPVLNVALPLAELYDQVNFESQE